MSQSHHHARLINGAALAAIVAIAGCQPPAQTAAGGGMAAPGAPAYHLQAAKAGKEAAPAAAAEPCASPTYAVIARNVNALFSMTGTRNTIDGHVWTNDGIKMAGNREVITGDAHYRDHIAIAGTSNYVAGAEVREVTAAPWDAPTVEEVMAHGPVYRFTGDVNLDKAGVWASPGVLKPGVYYTTGKFVLSTNGVKGKVTFIGQGVQLPGKNHDLEAYSEGVLAYALGYDANALHVSGNNGTYAGMFIAPNGEFQLTGNQNTIMGQVLCDSFKLSGGNNRIAISGVAGCPSEPPSVAPASPPQPSPSLAPSAEPSPEPSPSPAITPSPLASPPPSPSPSPTAAPASASPVASASPTAPSGKLSDYTDLDPMDVAADASGFIHTANYAGQSVSKLTPDGLASGVGAKNINVGFYLRGIAFAPDGTIWVAAIDADKVVHLRADGTKIGLPIPVGAVPSRVRVDGAGNVWTANVGSNYVTKLGPSGSPLGTYQVSSNEGEGTYDIAFDGANNAWVSGNLGTITKLSGADGTVLKQTTLSGNKGPWGITTDNAGNPWVALYNSNQVVRLSQFDLSPTYYTVGSLPLGIAGDQLGNVWVTNHGSNTAMRVTPGVGVTATLPTGSKPHGISIDRNGRVLVANSLSRTVTIITP